MDDDLYRQIVSNGLMQDPAFYYFPPLYNELTAKVMLDVYLRGTPYGVVQLSYIN
jgi:hypothetical protein